MTYTVTAPMVRVKDSTGRLLDFFRGSDLPDGLDKDHVQHLVDSELVVSGKADEALSGPAEIGALDGPLIPAGKQPTSTSKPRS